MLHLPRPLILASGSRYRRELLERLGFSFQAVTPVFEETRDPGLSPEELVQVLARGKALSLAQRFPDALILGADQLAEIDGHLLGKPGSAEQAVAQLIRLSGRSHRLLNGLALIEPATGRTETCLDIQKLSLRALPRATLERYVAAEQPLDCAGSYRIEGPGLALFRSLESQDYTGIIGLPLTKVTDLLLAFGARFE